jgi:hypothetical protein
MGGAIGSAVSAIAPMVNMGLNIINKVAIVAKVVMTVLNIFKPEEKIEEMGDRMMQAAEEGIKPEGYDKFDDYMQAIRNRPLDPEKSNATSLEAKQIAGVALSTMALESKFEGKVNLSDLWLLAGRNSDYFTGDKLIKVLDTFQDIKTVVNYFDGKLSPEAAKETKQKLFDIEKAASPEKDDNAIHSTLRSI